MSHLLQLVNKLVLSSGRESNFKIECDALTDKDIETVAFLIRRMVEPFAEVYGVPRGGLRLGAALKNGTTPPPPHTILIVDDVLTTGASMERLRDKHRQSGCRIMGAVLFARGPLPSWVRAVFTIDQGLIDL